MPFPYPTGTGVVERGRGRPAARGMQHIRALVTAFYQGALFNLLNACFTSSDSVSVFWSSRSSPLAYE